MKELVERKSQHFFIKNIQHLRYRCCIIFIEKAVALHYMKGKKKQTHKIDGYKKKDIFIERAVALLNLGRSFEHCKALAC